MSNQVFLSYSEGNRDAVDELARRLRGDGRLTFWFQPWNSVPGRPVQEQMEDALLDAQACAVFIGGSDAAIAGWQTEQMRTAIQTRVEDDGSYRVIPVLLPGAVRPGRRDLPPFLRRYEMVEFRDLNDESAYKRLLAGILGIPPIQLDGYVAEMIGKQQLPARAGQFKNGRALVVGVANYKSIRSLPATVVKDSTDIAEALKDAARCAYPPDQIVLLRNEQATRDGLIQALSELATCASPDDTVVVFSGHGAQLPDGRAFLLSYDATKEDLGGTALLSSDLTKLLNQIPAARLLVLLDCCHSGGIGEPKAALDDLAQGLTDEAYADLAQGHGRAVIASSRPEELSWILPGMDNSLFTHHLLGAFRGQARTLGDGYLRLFDLFRHVSDRVSRQATQHPIFKATDVDADFPIALQA
jgi:hypothetical protein